MTWGCVLFVPWDARLGTFSRHCHLLSTAHSLVTFSIQFHMEILWSKLPAQAGPPKPVVQDHVQSIFKTEGFIFSEQPVPVSGKQREITLFMNTKILGKKCSEVTSSQCCFHSYCDCVVYQTFHSTTLEQAVFWDYGQGMQQLLVKLTSLQFFYGILFFLWILRGGKHRQKPLPFRKQTPQSYDKATVYLSLQLNVQKQINNFSYDMPHSTFTQDN